MCAKHKKTIHPERQSETPSKIPGPPAIAETKKDNNTLLYIMIFISIGLIIFNQFTINQVAAATSGQPAPSGNAEQDAISLILAKGVPPVYGPELGISFDAPVAAMDAMKNFDPTYGSKKIILQGADLQRYIKIGTVPTIACEYCCGATTLIDSNGNAACGCAHSWAMRGLIAYLIKNHGTQYNDEEITQQAMKWKALFFPKQMVQKFMDQSAAGKYTPDIAAIIYGADLSRLGIAKSAGTGSALQSAPNMVGGC